MDDRMRYETVKSRLRVMGEGTAQQVHDAMDPSPYSVREVENTLDEMVLAEQDEFGKWVRCIDGKNTIGSVVEGRWTYGGESRGVSELR